MKVVSLYNKVARNTTEINKPFAGLELTSIHNTCPYLADESSTKVPVHARTATFCDRLNTWIKMEFTVDKLGDKVQEAYTRIKSHVWKTPLMYSLYLSTEGQAEVYLKLESEQLTGSFKLRGAFNKLLTLNKKPDQLKRGITTASSGNHGLACIAACKACNVPLEVFVSEEVNPTKLQNMRHHGVKVTLHGHDCVDAEIMARQTAAETGKLYISPYNDVDVMAGNGTVGCEIHNDLPEVDYVFVSVGGGGFIGGIAAYLKKVNPKIQVIGCQPRNSKVMYESVKVGYIKHDESLATLSDGTSGDIEDGSVSRIQI
ncbi:hypothetical protein DPMN_006355 [Dreissena polymorpha]|uniref:L-serine ammonia-lyase n=1 Tax=Dreissena polymorpha TaxID=45954 RepID=A0A9D4MWD1_DREPO|nr:hypothetical protein DPMN_006355 [Dreissena polymorpha]